ncbi:MAG TPA: NAD(P)H-quinone dehydrogenase [Mycobacteriales bacterium]|jgi:dihydrolipoamide dehydrogenase|nr:NAD(P)H-quinone dehydrogenase [Mycobacteriales bacterium]
MMRVAVIGGGPAGYEAALTAARLGAETTVIERSGAGGSCVLYDCVPSKTLIVSSVAATTFRNGDAVGVMAVEPDEVGINLPAVHGRIRGLALAQSADIHTSLTSAGVTVVAGSAALAAGAPGHLNRVLVAPVEGGPYSIDAHVVLLASGASPRVLPDAAPDGERILTWQQLYDLEELPESLVVVGSGVTGAEFASAYQGMGVQVTLVSSRDRVMPQEDADAARLITEVFANRGMTVVANARAVSVRNTGAGVLVTLADGRRIEASHALMTVGSVPNTDELGAAAVGVMLGPAGHVLVDRVSRTNVPGIYAAGDCTGVLALASVAASQGRIAMWHALGQAVSPLDLNTVAANIFTDPEIASVGVGQAQIDDGSVPARSITLPLATNARAKMQGLSEGFVKIFARPVSGLVAGGVIVAPCASELILPITMAVTNRLTVHQLAEASTIYPSLSGSITEAARRLIEYHQAD